MIYRIKNETANLKMTNATRTETYTEYTHKDLRIFKEFLYERN